MKRKFKRVHIFLFIAISFSTPVFLAYSHYVTLLEVDFLSIDLNFENSDQENLSFSYHSKSKILGSGSFTAGPLLENILFEPTFRCSSKTHSPDQKTLILRC